MINLLEKHRNKIILTCVIIIYAYYTVALSILLFGIDCNTQDNYSEIPETVTFCYDENKYFINWDLS